MWLAVVCAVSFRLLTPSIVHCFCFFFLPSCSLSLSQSASSLFIMPCDFVSVKAIHTCINECIHICRRIIIYTLFTISVDRMHITLCNEIIYWSYTQQQLKWEEAKSHLLHAHKLIVSFIFFSVISLFWIIFCEFFAFLLLELQ